MDKEKSILVTGGLGFVGLNISKYLAATSNAKIIVADFSTPDSNIMNFFKPVEKKIKIEFLDVRDRESFLSLANQHAISDIIHAAAVTFDYEQEKSNPSLLVDINLGGTINALTATYEIPTIERLLFVSSSGVYGSHIPKDIQTQSEDSLLQLDNLYAITKYAGELLSNRYYQLCNKPIASARLGSVYGLMEKPSSSRKGMSHIGKMFAALQENRHIKLFGPEIKRDWIYSLDLAQAISSLLFAPKWNYNTYNIGSGQTTAFSEIANAFEKQGLSFSWVDNSEEADVIMTNASTRAALDIQRLVTDTDFRPSYSILHGIEDYINSTNNVK